MYPEIQLAEFINYDQLFDILHRKYKATHDEINYWIKRSIAMWPMIGTESQELILDDTGYIKNEYLLPFESDLPFDGGNKFYGTIENFKDIHYCFYNLHDVNEFVPLPHLRFVYLRDLSIKRTWAEYKIEDKNGKNFSVLALANKAGILRCYDKETHTFTYHKTFSSGDKEKKQLWADTFEGNEILSNPETFFLLEDILKIERAFFNRPRSECLKELNIEMATPDLKVIDFMSQKKEPKTTKTIKKYIIIKNIPDFMLTKLHKILGDSIHTQEYNQKGQETLVTIRVEYKELTGDQIIQIMNNYNASVED